MKIKYSVDYKKNFIPLSQIKRGTIVTVTDIKQFPNETKNWCYADNLKLGDVVTVGQIRRNSYNHVGAEITVNRSYWHDIKHFNILDDENTV